MGPQDGVEVLLRSWSVLVNDMGRDDCHLALLGFGDCYDDLVAQAAALGLSDSVTFTGRANAEMIDQYLSTADVGVCPDPHSPLNDVSTMNKTMEYMAFGLPVVGFDLPESVVSAGDAAVWVPEDDVRGFARAMGDLLDDPARRLDLGVRARRRAVDVLDWRVQAAAYVSVFDKLLNLPERRLVVLPNTTAAAGRFVAFADRRCDDRAGARGGAAIVPEQRQAGAGEDRRSTAGLLSQPDVDGGVSP